MAAVTMDLARLRNFCIIAHIDHGKSTLADRLLDLTHAVSERQMRDQYLDKMELERERGITIKANAVRLAHTAGDGLEYVLNLIDTPAAQPERVAREIAQVVGVPTEEMLLVSAKTGQGVPELLEAIVRLVPPPQGDPDAPARALVFDSLYDSYRGVITYVRMVDGRLTRRERVRMMIAGGVSEAEEVGVFAPEAVTTQELAAGEVGYLSPGVKEVRQAKVGDTVTSAARPATEPLPGYREPRPMVYSGLYPIEGDDFPDLRDALD